MGQWAEVVPAPCTDPAEAGAVWRAERLRDLEWRCRCLGLHDSPEAAALLQAAAAASAQLDALAQQQVVSGAPWWADGEYDVQRADDANDAGARHFSAKEYSQAFEQYTEAIRLCPSRAVYHANRAAAALKLGRPDLALQDCQHALERDGKYVKAHVRAGAAQLACGAARQACAAYRAALALDAACRPAQAGLKNAEKAAAAAEACAARDAAAAQRGERAGMPCAALSDGEAAQLLLTAEGMLAANPSLEAANAAHVEALIHCRRYADAQQAAEQLAGGVDRQYLEAQAAWRAGDLAGAQGRLAAALVAQPHSAKCCELRSLVTRLQAEDSAAIQAMEDDLPALCVQHCTAALQLVEPAACTGLTAALLARRARAHLARAALDAALADANHALQLEPGNAECLLLRCQVHKERGAYQEAFLDAQRLRHAAPGHAALAGLLPELARLSLRQRGPAAGRPGQGWRAPPGEQDWYAVLGVSPACSDAEVRRAFRQLAVRWHPDKWQGADEEQRQKAEQQFRLIQQAYEVLRSDRQYGVHGS